LCYRSGADFNFHDVTDHSVIPRVSPPRETRTIAVKRLGMIEYEPAWRAMQAFTRTRTESTADELWLLQHPPVYTLGVAARPAHLPRGRSDIPVVRVDRGGQITYHGPGQAVLYVLLDMRRRGLTVRSLVRLMESTVIDLLDGYGILAIGSVDAPGVYVGTSKIAALGLRITRGACYHGLALNVDMDLTPFHAIDPCGYPGLAVTQLRDLGVTDSVERVGEKLARHLMEKLA
jgi:lipoyl(octanoyl) transferase